MPDREGLPTTEHMDRLCAAYERIAEEIRGIRETFDRLADDFAWALNNDKLKPECFPNFSALASSCLDARGRSDVGTTEDDTEEEREEPASETRIPTGRKRKRRSDLFS